MTYEMILQMINWMKIKNYLQFMILIMKMISKIQFNCINIFISNQLRIFKINIVYQQLKH